jgi:hypothetical protein
MPRPRVKADTFFRTKVVRTNIVRTNVVTPTGQHLAVIGEDPLVKYSFI